MPLTHWFKITLIKNLLNSFAFLMTECRLFVGEHANYSDWSRVEMTLTVTVSWMDQLLDCQSDRLSQEIYQRLGPLL